MDVRESFISNPAHIDDVGANITLNHSCSESSVTKGNDGGAQTDWLRDRCSGDTTPSSRNNTEPGRCLCCAEQCTPQNRNRDPHGDHAACSLHRARSACDPTPSHRSTPHAHEGHPAYRYSHSRCAALDSPERSQTYPRYRCDQHSEQRSANSTMSHWTSASARMQTGPYHEGELELSSFNCSLVKDKGMFLYSAVSSILVCSNRFILCLPGRPVHSGTYCL